MTEKDILSLKDAMDRRRFLRFSGICALAVLFGSACTRLDSGGAAAAISSCPYALTNDPYPGQCSNYIDSNASGYCDYSENISAQINQGNEPQTSAAQEPTAETTQTAAPIAQTENSTQSNPLVVLCNRGCSYPGHCRRFRDQDGSGICDLSEGVNPADL